MARVKMGFRDLPRKADAKLVAQLVDELKSNRESGQPFIYEETYPSGKIKVLVVWDIWDKLALEDRTNVILTAYEKSDGKGYRANIALANGLTMPEAIAAGMLPYRVATALRKSDPVTPDQCRAAMVAEGATQAFGPNQLELRFPTEETAEACKKRLVTVLPGSDEVWIIGRELGLPTEQDD